MFNPPAIALARTDDRVLAKRIHLMIHRSNVRHAAYFSASPRALIPIVLFPSFLSGFSFRFIAKQVTQIIDQRQLADSPLAVYRDEASVGTQAANPPTRSWVSFQPACSRMLVAMDER